MGAGESLAHNVAGNAKTFTAVTEGYAAGSQEAALIVAVTATGTNSNVTAALSGANPGDFTLTEAIDGLADGATGTFTVRPKDGLATGTHTATVTITSDEFAAGTTFTVTQVVDPALSSAKDITAFAVPAQVGASTIDAGAHTVTFHMANGTDVTALVPTVTVSASATVSPLSGAATDFTNAVTYTVTAENGSTQAWNRNLCS